MTRRGQCLCGSITWATDAPDLWAGLCHCESCRRATSSPVTAFFGVLRDSVRWTGTPKVYTSSPGILRGACPTCGAQVFYTSHRWPTEVHLYAATLENPADFQPQAHYHFAEKLPWLVVDDNLTKHPGSAD